MSDFYEKHLEKFYNYIINNENQIKYEVKKNITYEPELFEEAYSDTIVKVANAILVNHKVIDDFRFYFFISFKQNYIQMQNKKRKYDKINVYDCDLSDMTDDNDYDEREERCNRINILFNFICERLEEVFNSNEVDIYVIYYKLKSGKNRISYEKMSDIMNVDVKYITKVIQKIKRFIKEDNIINDKKEKILYGSIDDFNT